MEDMLMKLVSQAPSVVAIIIIVKIFFKFGEKSHSLLRQMHEEHLDARQESRETIKENSIVQKENTKAIEHLTLAIAKLQIRSHNE